MTSTDIDLQMAYWRACWDRMGPGSSPTLILGFTNSSHSGFGPPIVMGHDEEAATIPGMILLRASPSFVAAGDVTPSGSPPHVSTPQNLGPSMCSMWPAMRLCSKVGRVESDGASISGWEWDQKWLVKQVFPVQLPRVSCPGKACSSAWSSHLTSLR